MHCFLPLALKCLLVDEETIEQSIISLIEIEKTVAEGAGAVGLAALLAHPARFAGKRVGIPICGGNIIEVQHQRVFGTASVKSPEVEFVVETRDREHTQAIVAALEKNGVSAALH